MDGGWWEGKQGGELLGAGFARNPDETFRIMSAMGFYSEGVSSHSPGLPRFAATLGLNHDDIIYPEGVVSSLNFE